MNINNNLNITIDDNMVSTIKGNDILKVTKNVLEHNNIKNSNSYLDFNSF